jgi:hypothetical protein
MTVAGYAFKCYVGFIEGQAEAVVFCKYDAHRYTPIT